MRRPGTRFALLVTIAMVTTVNAAGRPPLVEHRVCGEEALSAARRLLRRGADDAATAAAGHGPAASSTDAAPGCQPCSRRELRYCEGDVMHDHCCCDMRYHEAFPFVPHTCYLRETPCEAVAGDCQHYERLRACCCDPLLRSYWAAAASAGSPRTQLAALTTLLLLLALR